MPSEFNGKKYYGLADVAKIIGVDKTTVWHWQNDLYLGCPLFTPDERAHDGRYLYEVERVMQLKSVYHPKWMHGGYESAPWESKPIDSRRKSFDLDALKQIPPSEHENRGLITKSECGERKENHGYCCIYCTSGRGENRSGALNFDYVNGIWVHRCQVCGGAGDNIKFFQQVFNANFQDACKQAHEMYHIPYLDGSAPRPSSKKEFIPPPIIQSDRITERYKAPERTKPEELPLIKADIKRAQEHLLDLPIDNSGGHYRGLHTKTYEYFGCGYIKNWVHPVNRLNGDKVYPSRRLIIPTSDGEHYLARKLHWDCKPGEKHIKMHAGRRTEVFNAADLKQPTVVVVEGEVDCMSIFETLYRNPKWSSIQPSENFFDFRDRHVGVVSTTYASGWQSLIISKIDAGLIEWRKFIILLDANKAGRDNAEDFRKALAERNFPVTVKFIYDYLTDDEKKKYGIGVDANDLLCHDRKRLSTILSNILYDAREEFGNIKNQTDLDFNQPVKKGFAIKGFDEAEAANPDEEEFYNCREDDEPDELPVDDTPAIVAADTDTKNFSAADTDAKKIPVTPADELKTQIDMWQNFNGEIAADFLPTIHAAANHLRGILQTGINATNVAELKTKQAIGMCKFYDFYLPLANAALVAIDDAKNNAAAEIKRYKATGNLTAEPSADCKILAQFSIRDFKADIDKIRKEHQKYHKDCQRAAKRAKAEAENQRKKQELIMQVDDNLSRLEELKKQPRTPERDLQIIALIRETCEWKLSAHGDRISVRNTAGNLDLIFKHDPFISNIVGFDEFQQIITCLKQAPWQKSNNRIGEEWRDADDSELRLYIRRTYTEFSDRHLIDDAVVSAANENSYHEVIEFINGLPEWDGVERMETLFPHFLGALDNRFNHVATRSLFMGMFARIYHPGCDFPYCFVLRGKQRTGKSRLTAMLAGKFGVNPNGKNWHVALRDSLDDSHAIDAIQKAWIVELEEMTATRKADITSIKAFISALDDTRRFAYGRHAQTVKRHIVAIATTNDSGFLKDPTGNTRFIIIDCFNEIYQQVAGMTPEYIRQVLAEALHEYNELFKDGFDESKLQLPADIRIESEEYNNKFLQDDGLMAELLAWIDIKIPPECVWFNLSREERARFCANGGNLTVQALQTRLNHSVRAKYQSKPTKAQEIINDIDKFFNSNFAHTENQYSTIYGSEYRTHICIAEIFNEAFATNDKRKSISRVNELFGALENHGWARGERFRKDTVYADQRKVLYRPVPEESADNPTPAPPERRDPSPLKADSDGFEFFDGSFIDPDDTPF